MKFKLSLLAILVCSTNAFASDTSGKYNWSGGYVGGQVGYSSGDSRLTPDGLRGYVKSSPNGFLGGIYGGYSHQFINNLVVGVDVDFNGANIKSNRGNIHPYNGSGHIDTRDVGFSMSTKMNWNGAVRARAGYAIDRFLPYIAGGLSYGSYEFKANVVGLGNGKNTKNMTGWNIGAGIDYAMTDSLVMRVEYRYSDFGKTKIIDGILPIDLKTHDVRLGLAYKF